jgi:hypothetical protein
MRTHLVLTLATLASSTFAGTVSIPASQDNTLYAESGNLSNGAGNYVFAGATGFGSPRRALIAFDVAAAIPAGSTIQSAALSLNMSMTNAGPSNVALHRVSASWGEGTSMAMSGEGGGALATTGDATWQYRFFATQSWTNLGGDFVATPSASISVDANGIYTWGSNAALVTDVQAWLDDPSTSFGWVLIGDESMSTTAKRFDSRTNATGVPPVLVVTFATPLGTSACVPGAGGVIACPCGNPPVGSNRGCNNSASTGGASIAGSGVASLAADSVQLMSAGELPNALSIVLQGNANNTGGLVFGEGVRCAAGTLKRLHTEHAVGGSIVYPDGLEPHVSTQSAALGDPIAPGSMRWYHVYYRDPSLPCTGEPNFNATQALAVAWGS